MRGPRTGKASDGHETMHVNTSRISRKTLERMCAALAGALVATALVATGTAPVDPATAQTQSLPGIIIAPSPGPGPGAPSGGIPPGMPGVMIAPSPGGLPPGAVVQPQQPPAPVAQPKPKPVAKPKVVRPPREDEATADALGKGPGVTRIQLLVNGDPITAYEVEQRARLMALGSDIQSTAQAKMKELATSEAVNARWKQIVQETVQANQGKSREQILAIIQEKQKVYAMGLQKQAIEHARASSIPKKREEARKELIEEQIKLQDARRNGASPDESMVEDLFRDLASRNKMSPAEFTRHFAGMGVDANTLKAKYRSQLAWTDTVRKQYGHLAQPSQRELDRAVEGFSGGEDQVELQLRRIVVSVPPKVDQKAMAARLAEAEQLRGQFKECRLMGALAARLEGARYEDMGSRTVTTFSEPSRTLLLSAPDNTMIPPTMTSSGIEMLAVCGRKVIKAVEKARNEFANKSRQEEFERIARNHLRKLMDNAVIENR